MKLKRLWIMLVVLVATAAGTQMARAGDAFEFETNHHPGYPVPYPVPMPMPAPVAPWGSSFNYCYANTICPNGAPIGCYAYGNPASSTACQWRMIANQYVECTGYNSFGQWAVSWARCY